MAITTVTNHLVFPTENDIHGGSSGAGRIGQELSLAALWKGVGASNCIVSGWSPIPTGAGFTKSIPGGIAVIDGYVVKGTGSPSFTFEASSTLQLFLRLNFDGSSKVSSLTLESYTGTTIPANSVKIAQVVTDGSGVTSQTDRRPQNRKIYGRVTGGTGAISDSGSGNWTCTRNGTGDYSITMETGYFFRTPCAVITTEGSTTWDSCVATSTTNLNVLTGGADQNFSFIAYL